MDLSQIEGLTPEQQDALTGLFEQETTGLKTKVDELLGEKKTAAQRAQEAEQIAKDAREAASNAEKEKLANEGKFEELRKLHEKEVAQARAEANEKAELAQSSLMKYHKGTELNQALSLIHDDYKDISQAMLSNMLEVSYNEQNEPVKSYKHNGQVVATNVDEFKSWALTQDSFKKIMNGVDSGGAGASNTNSASGANDKDAAFLQRMRSSGLTN